MKKAYITTSIAYVNSSPHIGYALEVVQTDTLARFYRLQNYDTYFLSGTDENAIKNIEAAEKENIPVQKFVDRNSRLFFNLKHSLNLSFNQFIRTTDPKHKKNSQELWKLCKKDIYKKKYKGLYCTGCETFYKDKEFKDNICPEHNKKLEVVEEENYFFSLSKYANMLKDIYEKDIIKVYPEYRKKEALKYINKGLEDFSASRPIKRTKGWGIRIPNDNSQTIYVWFDAVANYITALDFSNQGTLFKKYWLNNDNKIHIIGKDITKFHLIYWPAILLSAKLPLPSKIYIHGFITIEGKKISKTLGNVVNPNDLVKKYGTDAVRYYLLREIPSLNDGNYSNKRMDEIYNSDLANELGNLVLRITNIAEQDKINIKKRKIINIYSKEEIKLFENFNFNKILENIWNNVKKINKSIDEFAPWKKNKDQRKEFIQKTLKEINTIGIKLQPFLPNTAEKIIKATECNIKKIKALFPKKE